jgi:hypothetical protein
VLPVKIRLINGGIDMFPMTVGALLALAIAIFARITGFDRDRSFYSVVLMVIASYYVLFACIAGEAIIKEVVAASIFTVVAVVGALRWPLLLGAGIMLHGVFDFVHGDIIDNSGVPEWWPIFCASLDIVLGLWVIFLVKKISGARSGQAPLL